MILLDAKAVMHHSYHSGDDPDSVITELGNKINTAEFGFNRFMERYMLPILEDDAPAEILIAHDAGTRYRTALFPEYKKSAARVDKDPQEVAEQRKLFDMMKRFWAAIGCTQAKVEGVEADDLLAYFCQTLPGNHDLYTVDNDLLQLQGDHENVSVLLKCEYQDDPEGHKGIPYAYTSLSKSMLGDASDNYGGVFGFGRKKWDDIVTAYGYDGLDQLRQCVETKDYTMLIEALQATGDKGLKLLYERRDEWRKGWELAKLHPELCWKPHASKKVVTSIEWFKRVPDGAMVNKVFNSMGCKDLIDDERVSQWLPVQWMMSSADVDEDLFSEFEAECKKSPVVGFDYETYPSEDAMLEDPKGKGYVDVKEALIAGASFTFGANLNFTFYLPVNHKDTDNVDLKTLDRLVKIAQDNSELVVQNAAFELAVSKNPQNLNRWLDPLHDTRTMQYYVNEEADAHLKVMSKTLLGYEQTSYKDTVWSEEEQRMRTMDELTGEEVLFYGCDDAIVTSHLFVLFKIILQIEGTYDFVERYETCSQHSLVDAYLKGATIDWEALESQRKVDVAAVEDNYETLRGLLSEHCSSPNEDAAKEFTNSQKDYIKAVAKADAKEKIGKGRGQYTEEDTKAISAAGQAAVDKFYKKALQGSMYEPFVTRVEAVEFKPTVKQFSEVMEFLKIELECFKTTSRAAISQWLVCVTDLDFDAPKSSAKLTPDQTKFCNLLGDAQDQISKREGAEYEKLVQFCEKHRNVTGKEIQTGDELNTGSPQQMQHLLYCKLGLPVRLTNMVVRGSKRDQLGLREGSPQTDALAMDTALAEDTEEGDWRREAINCIKAIKEAKTRISLYHDSYPLWKHPTDGKIHPQVKIIGTVTRRPSGTLPNVLQVSKHQQEGVMRSIFIPGSDEEVIVSIDFSQQELRIMASESGDENLISCYVGDNQRDVHSLTASGIAKITYSEFMEAYADKEHAKHKVMTGIRKRPAKATNFLFAYLGEAHTLSQRLIIPFAEADDMMNAAYRTYPKVQPWQEAVIAFATRNGYSKTAYGNRRHLSPDFFSLDKAAIKRVQRQLVNAVIQGGAADILKIVLTECWLSNLWEETGSTLLAPVYDEITASVPKSTVCEYIHRLVSIMEITPPGHVVPMVADVSLGKNWRDQIEIGVRPTDETILAALEEINNG